MESAQVPDIIDLTNDEARRWFEATNFARFLVPTNKTGDAEQPSSSVDVVT